jgi:signal transduction histidine kinase
MDARTLKSDAGVVALKSAHLELVREDEPLQDRPWAEAALAGEKRVLEMITDGDSLPSILEVMRQVVEEITRGSEGRGLSTLAILSREPYNPAPEDQEVIKQFTHLASIAVERARSEEALRQSQAEALRASAQLARGQMEALTSTLDALAKESAADRLVEHVLRTMIGQLHAHSSGVWLRSEGTRRVRFEFGFEGGRLLTKSDAALAKISPTLNIEDVPPWPEIFRTGKPGVLEDIRDGPAFPWREHVLSLGVITILIVPMLIAGQVEGVIGIRFTGKRPFRAEEIELAQALAHQAMLVIQLGRLSQQSRQAAVAAERNRLARDIHDTLAQGFTGVIVQLEAAADAISGGLMKEANEHIARASDLARGSLQEARRSVQALRPQALEEKDLCGALEDVLKKMTTGTALRAALALEGAPRPLPPEWGENLLRIGQEVLTNSLRHASASEFTARLSFEQDCVHLILRDNGRGFDPAAKHDGFGVRGIRERVEAMNGQLAIQSGKDQGTIVSITLRCADNVQPGLP